MISRRLSRPNRNLRGRCFVLSNPALRRHSAPLMLMLALAGPGGPTGHAQQNRDPFDVQRLRPATPSSFWEGPRGTCAAPLQVPDPLRLADAVDVALCNNPQTRQSWANAKVQAAQVGIARSDYLPSIDAAAVLQRHADLEHAGLGRGDQPQRRADLQLSAVRFRRP